MTAGGEVATFRMGGWPAWLRRDRTALARYVTADAGRRLPQRLGPMGPPTPEGRRDLVKAIYEALSDARIDIDVEPLSTDFTQVIRSPDEVFHTHRANCLDMAALFCGLCLANRLLPVLVVLDGQALAAVSLHYDLDRLRGMRPERDTFIDGVLPDAADLWSLVESGRYLAVDCAGAARTAAAGVRPFEAAVMDARKLLAPGRASFRFALDVVDLHDVGHAPLALPGAAYPALVPALPYDTAIDSFVADHLGAGAEPVPFGGRGPELAALDRWLDEPGPPYLVLTAGAGGGKSTLLVRWLDRLTAGDADAGRRVVFVPISARYELNAEIPVLVALVTRLASVHQERPITSGLGAIELRALLDDYVRRPPAGGTLLIVIDGLDEASGWEAGPSQLPHTLPDGTRIAVSARRTPTRPGPAQWCRQLGLAEPQARLMALTPLTEEGILDVLESAGRPGESTAGLSELAGELHRLSEGDPLVLSLYLRDGADLRREDLQRLTPGFAAFLDRWWEEQRRLRARPVLSDVSDVLGLLAFALGPLDRRDILELAGEGSPIDGRRLDAALDALQGHVGTGPTPFSLTLSHPRLAHHWPDRLLASRQRDAYRRRLLEWCRRTAADLRERGRHPASAPGYVVRHFADHLESSGAPAGELLDLADPTWAAAWDASAEEVSCHPGDLERALRATLAANGREVAAGRPAPLLAEQVACMAALADASSFSELLSPELVVQLVTHGVWSDQRALSYVAGIRPPIDRAAALAVVAPRLRPTSTAAALALYASVSDAPDRERAEALGGCVVLLANAGRWPEAIAMARRPMEDQGQPRLTAFALLDALPHLPESGRAEALGTVLAAAGRLAMEPRREVLGRLTHGVDRETAAALLGEREGARDPAAVVLALLSSEQGEPPADAAPAALSPAHLMLAGPWMTGARLERELAATLASLNPTFAPLTGPMIASLLPVVPDRSVADLAGLAASFAPQDAHVLVDVLRRPWAAPGLDTDRFIAETGEALLLGTDPAAARAFLRRLAELGRGEAALRLLERAWADDGSRTLASIAPALTEAQVSRILGVLHHLPRADQTAPRSALLARLASFGPEQATAALGQARTAAPGGEATAAAAVLLSFARGQPAVRALLGIGDEKLRCAALVVASASGEIVLEAFDEAFCSFASGPLARAAFEGMLPALADADVLAARLLELVRKLCAAWQLDGGQDSTAISYLRRVRRAAGPEAALERGRELSRPLWEEPVAWALVAAPDQDWATPEDAVRAVRAVESPVLRAAALGAALAAFPAWRDELWAALRGALDERPAQPFSWQLRLLFQVLGEADRRLLTETLLPPGLCDRIEPDVDWPTMVTDLCGAMDHDEVLRAWQTAWEASGEDRSRVHASLAGRLSELGHLDEALSRLEGIMDSRSEHVCRGLAGVAAAVPGDRLPRWLALAHRKLSGPLSGPDRAVAWASLAHRWAGFDDRSRWQAISAWADRQRYRDRADVLVDVLGYAPALQAAGGPGTADNLIARLGLEDTLPP